MLASTSFLSVISIVSPTRTRMNGPGTVRLNVQYRIGRAVSQPTFQLHALKGDLHPARLAPGDWRREARRRQRDVRLCGRRRLGRARRTDDEPAFHPGQAMPGNGAEIGPLPDGPGAEGDRRACPDADDVLRCDVLFGEHDVVLSAFAIDQGDLDYVVFSGSKLRIDHAVDVRADPDEHHAALGNAGFERVSHIRRVAGRYR